MKEIGVGKCGINRKELNFASEVVKIYTGCMLRTNFGIDSLAPCVKLGSIRTCAGKVDVPLHFLQKLFL